MFTSQELGSSWGEYDLDGQMTMSFIGRTRASLYWHGGGRVVKALDQSMPELSSSELPESVEPLYLEGMQLEVVAGRDDEPRILDLAMPARGGVLRVFAMPGQGSGELWEPEKTIQLSAVAAGLLGYLPSYLSGIEAVEWINVTDAAAVVGVSFGHGDAGGGARGRRCRTSGMWRSHANCHGHSNLQLHAHDHSKNPSNVDGCTNTVTISVSVTLMHASCSSLPHK
ncbi:hypothetical protein HU200_065884 [Digitaria exilis]|uniref:Uncharacterized protein n=1 Tax=Digitaria exilis TaxID=1010633 RepID=A0A835A133_9POAL|nr:hypothetical protein HU200_065884 [Digitaria exilis]